MKFSYRSLAAWLLIPLTPLAFAFAQEDAPASSNSPDTSPSSGLYIKVGEAQLKKSLMAIPPFQFVGSPSNAANGMKAGKELYDVFRNNMEVSGLFEFIRPAAYLEDVSKVGLKPSTQETGGFNFSSWKQIGTEFLVRVGYRVTGNDISVDAYAYFVPQQKLIIGKTYRAKVQDVRVVAHTFANDLVKELTGQRGMFLSKLVVSRTTSGQEKEIFIMDWDGANPKQVSNHRSIAQSPAWSPDGNAIAYSAFAYHKAEKTRNLDLFTYDLSSGRRFVVSYRRGINSGANFMPDNKHLLLTISNAGNPDIYRMSLDGKSITRLTNGKSGEMNVEPAVSPDGKKIAFSSTRSGRPMIFVMNADGSNVKRLTIAGEYNSTPSWSPDGKKITFAGFDKSNFDIFVMDADGTNMSRLTSAKKANGRMANNEDPSFSPDGRSILFRSDRNGKYQLYIVSVDGEDERRITFDQHDYAKPRWSPFLD
jgi:TolB protein